jgi:hypothetical protein
MIITIIFDSLLECWCNSMPEVQRTMLQIVTKLDGFDARGNIKVRMATNRPDTDPALLRPGRLDRTVKLSLGCLICKGVLIFFASMSGRGELLVSCHISQLSTCGILAPKIHI